MVVTGHDRPGSCSARIPILIDRQFRRFTVSHPALVDVIVLACAVATPAVDAPLIAVGQHNMNRTTVRTAPLGLIVQVAGIEHRTCRSIIQRQNFAGVGSTVQVAHEELPLIVFREMVPTAGAVRRPTRICVRRLVSKQDVFQIQLIRIGRVAVDFIPELAVRDIRQQEHRVVVAVIRRVVARIESILPWRQVTAQPRSDRQRRL